jgi:hypothetical protein
MPNGVYRLPSGRTVQLERLYLDSTYAGVMEGSPERASPSILRQQREEARRLLAPGKPIVVSDPGCIPLPTYRLIAELVSRKGVRNTAPEFSSHLFIAWFSDEISKPIDELIGPVLDELDWDRHAEDFDIMNV